MAAAVVGIAVVTGGSLVRALVIGAFFFVAATAWSWRRWRERLREEERRRT
jgi:membrane protein implicated in regulation of membrane protease activity